MAHKKRKHHSHKARRRRVGAVGGGKQDKMIKLAAVVGGWFLGDTINEQVDKILPKETTTSSTGTAVTQANQWVGVAGEVGIGGLLLMRKKGTGTMKMVQSVAGGLLAGAGIKRAAKKMGLISGYQSVPVIGRRMAGYQSTPVIAGRTPSQLAGKMPGQLQGFRVNGYSNQGSGVGAMAGSASMMR